MRELYEKFTANYIDSPDYSIEFFNSHRIIFNNIKHFNNQMDFGLFMEMFYAYINALEKKNQYNNIIDAVLVSLTTVENAIDEFGISRSTFNLYKWLLFLYGSAYYYLKDYNTALKIFNAIKKYDPENDKLDLWIEYSILGRIKLYVRVLYFVAFIGLMIDLLGKRWISNYIRLPCLIFSLLICFIVFGLEAYSNRKRRKGKL